MLNKMMVWANEKFNLSLAGLRQGVWGLNCRFLFIVRPHSIWLWPFCPPVSFWWRWPRGLPWWNASLPCICLFSTLHPSYKKRNWCQATVIRYFFNDSFPFEMIWVFVHPLCFIKKAWLWTLSMPGFFESSVHLSPPIRWLSSQQFKRCWCQAIVILYFFWFIPHHYRLIQNPSINRPNPSDREGSQDDSPCRHNPHSRKYHQRIFW